MLFELLKDHFWMFSMEFRTIPDRWCKQSIAGVRILDGGSCTMMACSKTFVKCKHLVLNSRDSNDWVLKLYHYISNLDLSISFFQMFFLDEWDPIASLPPTFFPFDASFSKKLPRSMSLLSSQIDVAVAEALQLEVPHWCGIEVASVPGRNPPYTQPSWARSHIEIWLVLLLHIDVM